MLSFFFFQDKVSLEETILCKKVDLCKNPMRTSLMVQQLRIFLPVQGTRWVWALVGEDSTCLRTTKSVHRIYWGHTLEADQARGYEKPLQHEACTQQLERSPRSPQLEKACAEQLSPHTAKNKSSFLKKELPTITIQMWWVRGYLRILHQILVIFFCFWMLSCIVNFQISFSTAQHGQ